jgi:Mannosyl-glycoprotein endo-beta-N-acetylglucosaminidase/LysM domain
MSLKRLLIVLTLLASGGLQAQNSDVINYINTYKELAIREMQRTGVPASITLAQGIHESMAGKSELVLKSNNHFGIKCKSTWAGEKVYHDDDLQQECFRSYTTPAESFVDHSDFLKNGPRYSSLFTLDPADYKDWAYGLKKAGYATNNRYPEILIKYIEEYNLQQYSLIAMGVLSPKDEVLAGNGKPVGDITFASSVKKEDPVVEELPALPKIQYPSGEFTINNTKVIFAAGGTSLLFIAKQYDIPLGRLLDFNDMKDEDVLERDQLLYLQRKRKTGSNEFHFVQAGESLYSICQSEGLRLESLMEYNHLQSMTVPATGEKLYLRSAAPSMPRLSEKVAMTSVEQTKKLN